jgi:hypothetical protein
MSNISFKKAKIGAPDISFGTGTFVRQKSDGTYMNVNQVYAASIPIADAGVHFVAGNRRVEYAIGQLATRIDVVSASYSTRTNALSNSYTALPTTLSQTNQSATIASLVKFWWKHPYGTIQNTSDTRITFPAGYYPVGGKLYYAAATKGWSTQRGAGSVATQRWHNRGFSFATGALALGTGWRKSNTWYYAYATKYANSLAFVLAGTAPTTKYDNGLWGSDWDTNTYLGAVRFAVSSQIVTFVQSGNYTNMSNVLFMGRTYFSATNNTLLPIIATGPQTTNNMLIKIRNVPNSAGSIVGLGLYAPCSEEKLYYGVRLNVESYDELHMPMLASTRNLFYWKRVSYTWPGSITLYTSGWIDKFN